MPHLRQVQLLQRDKGLSRVGSERPLDKMSMPSSTARERLFQKYWQAGAVKNRVNVSCELRECRRDKSKTEWQIRNGRWIEIASTFGSLGR
jgi:hypothetical protein